MELRAPPGFTGNVETMIEMAQLAADAAALNALNQIAEWLHEKDHHELAEELLKTFGAPSEGEEEGEGAPDHIVNTGSLHESLADIVNAAHVTVAKQILGED